jgi:hypothetical protein
MSVLAEAVAVVIGSLSDTALGIGGRPATRPRAVARAAE